MYELLICQELLAAFDSNLDGLKEFNVHKTDVVGFPGFIERKRKETAKQNNYLSNKSLRL